MPNITLRTLFTASSPSPLTVTTEDAPAEPANIVSGENPVTLPTNNSPLPALTNVAFDTEANKFTHTEYDPWARPTLTGKLTLNTVLLLDPAFTNELANTLGDAQPEPTANATLRTLFTASSPTPLTLIVLDAPPT